MKEVHLYWVICYFKIVKHTSVPVQVLMSVIWGWMTVMIMPTVPIPSVPLSVPVMLVSMVMEKSVVSFPLHIISLSGNSKFLDMIIVGKILP